MASGRVADAAPRRCDRGQVLHARAICLLCGEPRPHRVLSYSFDPSSDSTKYVIETAFTTRARAAHVHGRRALLDVPRAARVGAQLALPHKLPAKKKLLNTEKVKKQRVDRLQDYLCRAVAAAGPRPPRALRSSSACPR